MSIFKIHKSNNFSIVSNKIINDKRLSWKARGILIYLLSKPENWTVKMFDLINSSEKDGQVSVQNALKELKEMGYVELIRGEFKNDKNENVFGSFYNVYEAPRGVQP